MPEAPQVREVTGREVGSTLGCRGAVRSVTATLSAQRLVVLVCRRLMGELLRPVTSVHETRSGGPEVSQPLSPFQRRESASGVVLRECMVALIDNLLIFQMLTNPSL